MFNRFFPQYRVYKKYNNNLDFPWKYEIRMRFLFWYFTIASCEQLSEARMLIEYMIESKKEENTIVYSR